MPDCRHGIQVEGVDDAYMCDLEEGHEEEDHLCTDQGFPLREDDEDGGTVHTVQTLIPMEIRWKWPITTPTE